MILNTFSVHFVVRKDKMDKNGFASIYAKVTLNGRLLAISTNHKVLQQDWSINDERVKPTCKFYKEINQSIDSLLSRIYQAHSFLLATNMPLTTQKLKIQLFGIEPETKMPTLLEVIEQHNSNFKKMVGIKYSAGSYKNYKTSLKFLKEFIPTFKSKNDIQLKEVNYKFAEAFFTFLTTSKTSNQNGANKHIQRLKTIINYAIKLEYLQSNPLNSFSLAFRPVNKIALTIDELSKLQNLKLQRKTLQDVQTVFLFQCYTGLCYGDVKRLSGKHIQLMNNGDYWIKMSREKTKIDFSVPLLPKAFLLIERYLSITDKETPLLPVLSNQKMNDNLKILQELATISKNLTSHLARHTFATTITLGNGVPIETVSRMLGHTKLTTTQMYAKVLDKKIMDDMEVLKSKMEIF